SGGVFIEFGGKNPPSGGTCPRVAGRSAVASKNTPPRPVHPAEPSNPRDLPFLGLSGMTTFGQTFRRNRKVLLELAGTRWAESSQNCSFSCSFKTFRRYFPCLRRNCGPAQRSLRRRWR